MKKIRLAIVGVGNCASSLIQGIEFYKRNNSEDKRLALGLMHYEIGGYRPQDIDVVCAIDIDKRKVGKPVSKAIFTAPNCTKRIIDKVSDNGVKVSMGHIYDGVSEHMKDYPLDRTFAPANVAPTDIVELLKKTKADVLISYLPVGSQSATEFYAQCCLDSGVAFINCMPVFIASNPVWAKKFIDRGIPIIGDDIKSQVGATIVHRTLARLFEDRGAKIDRTYQLNTGGNTDFLNMLNRSRLKSKKISKTESVQSQLVERLESENIHIGPSDYVPWQNDNKVAFIRIEARGFANIPLNMEVRLSVEDSPNSAGVAVDAIRCAKLAKERKLKGPLYSISAYLMKHPPKQFTDNQAKKMVSEFIEGSRKD